MSGADVSVCGNCGYGREGHVIEIEWEMLERCPSCGAYQWVPEPTKMPEIGWPARGPHD